MVYHGNISNHYRNTFCKVIHLYSILLMECTCPPFLKKLDYSIVTKYYIIMLRGHYKCSASRFCNRSFFERIWFYIYYSFQTCCRINATISFNKRKDILSYRLHFPRTFLLFLHIMLLLLNHVREIYTLRKLNVTG